MRRQIGTRQSSWVCGVKLPLKSNSEESLAYVVHLVRIFFESDSADVAQRSQYRRHFDGVYGMTRTTRSGQNVVIEFTFEVDSGEDALRLITNTISVTTIVLRRSLFKLPTAPFPII